MIVVSQGWTMPVSERRETDSRLIGTDEEGTLAGLKGIRRELVDPRIVEHRGRIVKTTGDGLLVEFASVVDAVRCAVDVQREMAARNADVPADTRIEFRVGINLGDIIVEHDDIFGGGVNVAARLEMLAEPGGICVNRVVRDQVRDKLDIALGPVTTLNRSIPPSSRACRLRRPSCALSTCCTIWCSRPARSPIFIRRDLRPSQTGNPSLVLPLGFIDPRGLHGCLP